MHISYTDNQSKQLYTVKTQILPLIQHDTYTKAYTKYPTSAFIKINDNTKTRKHSSDLCQCQ